MCVIKSNTPSRMQSLKKAFPVNFLKFLFRLSFNIHLSSSYNSFSFCKGQLPRGHPGHMDFLAPGLAVLSRTALSGNQVGDIKTRKILTQAMAFPTYFTWTTQSGKMI